MHVLTFTGRTQISPTRCRDAKIRTGDDWRQVHRVRRRRDGCLSFEKKSRIVTFGFVLCRRWLPHCRRYLVLLRGPQQTRLPNLVAREDFSVQSFAGYLLEEVERLPHFVASFAADLGALSISFACICKHLTFGFLSVAP